MNEKKQKPARQIAREQLHEPKPWESSHQSNQSQGWEEEFDAFYLEEYGKWRIGREEAKQFIRDLLSRTEAENVRKLEATDFYGWNEETQQMIKKKVLGALQSKETEQQS